MDTNVPNSLPTFSGSSSRRESKDDDEDESDNSRTISMTANAVNGHNVNSVSKKSSAQLSPTTIDQPFSLGSSAASDNVMPLTGFLSTHYPSNENVAGADFPIPYPSSRSHSMSSRLQNTQKGPGARLHSYDPKLPCPQSLLSLVPLPYVQALNSPFPVFRDDQTSRQAPPPTQRFFATTPRLGKYLDIIEKLVAYGCPQAPVAKPTGSSEESGASKETEGAENETGISEGATNSSVASKSSTVDGSNGEPTSGTAEKTENGTSTTTASAASAAKDAPRNAAEKPWLDCDTVQRLCADACSTFADESTLLSLYVTHGDSLVIVGDVHGQFKDMCQFVLAHQFDPLLNPKRVDRKFLFIGDYVDRGPQSVEVLVLLLALKVEYPQQIFMLRGNHEDPQMTRIYGFYQEAGVKFAKGQDMWAAFNKVFCFLPLAALVTVHTVRLFAVHGGLSPDVGRLQQIAELVRTDYGSVMDNVESGVVDGFLWSDPTDVKPRCVKSERGCGYLFGRVTSLNFCNTNDLNFIVRAHQMMVNGYGVNHDNRVLTVFSAPNYCGACSNRGAILIIESDERMAFVQFDGISGVTGGTGQLDDDLRKNLFNDDAPKPVMDRDNPFFEDFM